MRFLGEWVTEEKYGFGEVLCWGLLDEGRNKLILDVLELDCSVIQEEDGTKGNKR